MSEIYFNKDIFIWTTICRLSWYTLPLGGTVAKKISWIWGGGGGDSWRDMVLSMRQGVLSTSRTECVTIEGYYVHQGRTKLSNSPVTTFNPVQALLMVLPTPTYYALSCKEASVLPTPSLKTESHHDTNSVVTGGDTSSDGKVVIIAAFVHQMACRWTSHKTLPN